RPCFDKPRQTLLVDFVFVGRSHKFDDSLEVRDPNPRAFTAHREERLVLAPADTVEVHALITRRGLQYLASGMHRHGSVASSACPRGRYVPTPRGRQLLSEAQRSLAMRIDAEPTAAPTRGP